MQNNNRTKAIYKVQPYTKHKAQKTRETRKVKSKDESHGGQVPSRHVALSNNVGPYGSGSSMGYGALMGLATYGGVCWWAGIGTKGQLQDLSVMSPRDASCLLFNGKFLSFSHFARKSSMLPDIAAMTPCCNDLCFQKLKSN